MAGPNHNVIKRLMAASEGGRWDALPGEVLDAIGRALADRAEAEHRWLVRWAPLGGSARAWGAAPGDRAGAALPRDGLLAFACTCRAWRASQRRLGRLRTRVRTAVGRGTSAAAARWSCERMGCPVKEGYEAAWAAGNREVLALLAARLLPPGPATPRSEIVARHPCL